MSRAVSITIAAMPARTPEALVVFAGADLGLSKQARTALGAAGVRSVERAAGLEKFKGKAASVCMIVAPAGTNYERVLLVGMSADGDAKTDYAMLGGVVAGALGKVNAASVIMQTMAGDVNPQDIGAFAMGVQMRAYAFDAYKTVKREDKPALALTLVTSDPASAKAAVREREAIAQGVNIARDLVNEPPNILYPVEFARRAAGLKKQGVQVEILGERQLAKIGMRALLGVGQGSRRESQVVIMRWNGAAKSVQPVAFIGKGVTFDTGGISIKPAGGMEDMKGDMAGAACVVGLMHALAARKAKVNAIGVIGLVENMPDGNAQRPGDIVKSLSGQTIEIINTDAEGRLVLADVLWYTQDRYKPAFMVNLATLTGACIVALGKEHAGLFSNDDALAERLHAAGQATGDKVWRMPLTDAYDKMIDSKFADVKNAAGRDAGAITAAQFLQRFVNKTPWAHLDIAGPAMGSPQNEIQKSWSSGFGVRLLNRLVEDHYEGRDLTARKAASRGQGRKTVGAGRATPASQAVRDTPVGADRRNARDTQR